MEDETLTPGQRVAQKIISGFSDPLMRVGITETLLARKLKSELNAKTTKTAKVKGPLDEKVKLNKGIKAAALSKGDLQAAGDTLLMWNETDWTIRQRARMDAHKLLNHYPAEKHEHGFSKEALSAIIDGLPDDFAKAVCSALAAAISPKHS